MVIIYQSNCTTKIAFPPMKLNSQRGIRSLQQLRFCCQPPSYRLLQVASELPEFTYSETVNFAASGYILIQLFTRQWILNNVCPISNHSGVFFLVTNDTIMRLTHSDTFYFGNPKKLRLWNTTFNIGKLDSGLRQFRQEVAQAMVSKLMDM